MLMYVIFTLKGFKEADKFICGKCCQLFVSLDQFMVHKGECLLRQKVCDESGLTQSRFIN